MSLDIWLPLLTVSEANMREHWAVKAKRKKQHTQVADECGALKTENTALLAENARLRRRIEDMERKGKKR